MWVEDPWSQFDKGAEADEDYPKSPFGSFPGFKLGLRKTGLPSVWELLWVPSTCRVLSLPHGFRSR
jgi:hypothetical protein